MRYSIEGQWNCVWKICPTTHPTQTTVASPPAHAKWKLFTMVEQRYDPFLVFPVVPRYTSLCYHKCSCWKDFKASTTRRTTCICRALEQHLNPNVVKLIAHLAFKHSLEDHFFFCTSAPKCMCRLCDCGRCAAMRAAYEPLVHSALLR